LQEALSRGVHEPQKLVGIESEQWDIDLFDHPAQQSGGFNGANLLIGQKVGQSVHFERQFAESIIGGSATRAKGVVLFAQGRDHIGKGLKGSSGLFLQGHRQQPPDKHFGEEQSELGFERPRLQPDENAACYKAGQGNEEREKTDTPLIKKASPPA
jgi:hypothetical protein